MSPILEKLIIFFLSIFLFGYLIDGISKIKYIGLYGSIILYIVLVFKNKNLIIETYKEHWAKYKVVLLGFFLFLSTVVISIIFSYSDMKYSLKEFRIEFLNIGIFMLIVFGIKNKILLFKYFLFAILFAFSFDVIWFLYHYIKVNPELNLSIRLERNYGSYFELLFPFVLGSLFILKNKFKYILILFLFIGSFELILTGARGSWATVLSELIMFSVGVFYLNKQYLNKIILGFLLLATVTVTGVHYLSKHSTLVEERLIHGLNSSGRDVIIKTRLPIFLKNANLVVGIGGPGNYQYNKFLNDYHAPKVIGVKNGSTYIYDATDPFLLQIFYKEGVLGLFSFFIFIIIFLKKSFFSFKHNSTYEIQYFSLALFTSFIGFFLVRGLVEGRQLQYLVLYLVLYLAIPKGKQI